MTGVCRGCEKKLAKRFALPSVAQVAELGCSLEITSFESDPDQLLCVPSTDSCTLGALTLKSIRR
jgi:hypothetical protein